MRNRRKEKMIKRKMLTCRFASGHSASNTVLKSATDWTATRWSTFCRTAAAVDCKSH